MSVAHSSKVTAGHRPRGSVQPRTLVFGGLIVAFAAGLVFAGHQVGMTTGGLPPEQHPSLLIERGSLDDARERLAREPYAGWVARLRARVEKPPVGRELGPLVVSARAKELACLYALTSDRGYADGAVAGLRKLRTSPRGQQWRSPDELVATAANLALAYDLLAPYLRTQPTAETRARDLVFGAGASLWSIGDRWAGPGGAARSLRYCSSLGLCALAVSDRAPDTGHAGPRDWYKRARTAYRDTLKRAVADDGAFAEGPGQHYDAAKLYLPFAAASQHVMGDDLLSGSALKACEWSVRMRLPNGARPNVDSSALAPSCGYAVSAAGGDTGLYLWDTVSSGSGGMVPDDQLCEALLLRDDSEHDGEPEWEPTQFLTASGDVAFRSGWDRNATYGLLRAESGRARLAGGPLEQADSTSVLIGKGSELLTLDCGYGGPKTLGETAAARSHSLVLMDGEGPPVKRVLGRVAEVDSDTQLVDTVHAGDLLETATAVRRQPEGTFTRMVLLLRDRDFVIIDRVVATAGEHEFTWRLHCNAGADTGGKLQVVGHRAEVNRPGARLGVWAWAAGESDDLSLGVEDGRHYAGTPTPHGHLVLTADAPRGRSGAFVSVLSPRATGDALPRVSEVRGDGWLRVTIGAGLHVVVRVGCAGPLGDGSVGADGEVLVWEEDRTGAVLAAVALGATQLRVGSSAPVSSRERGVLRWPADASGGAARRNRGSGGHNTS